MTPDSLGTELAQVVIEMIKDGPTYAPDGSHVGLFGIYSVDELLDIAIELETKAKQSGDAVAAFDHLMGAA
jgi:hypothetical protein